MDKCFSFFSGVDCNAKVLYRLKERIAAGDIPKYVSLVIKLKKCNKNGATLILYLEDYETEELLTKCAEVYLEKGGDVHFRDLENAFKIELK